MSIPTLTLSSPKPSFTPKELPKNKVRTHVSDQTGQIDKYFPGLKRNYTEDVDEDETSPIIDLEPAQKK